ncbi:crosslink repair DNA glycosylase YcaQ family protein [Micromonospora sp. NPDC002717]|uniref:DNA glycosylase AlkZ-like family protein n=1 Tax=Micromonospora sp. NPDC002717 TaxID=3154424 RepID=UPI00332476C8
MSVHRLDRTEARRIAVRAQLLDTPRPADLMTVVRHLTLLQIDPTAAVAPNADLVAWSRLRSSYEPAHLQQALERDRTLFEHQAMVRPMDDLRLYLAVMATLPAGERQREWLRRNDRFRRDVLDLLGAAGPLLSRDIPDTSVVAWPSTGWTNNRNVTQMLEFLVMRGEVAIAGRRGRQRLWDLAERVYPAGTPVVPLDEARRIRDERLLRSLGIVRATALSGGDASGVGEPATVEGLPGTWRVDPAAVGRPFTGRTALLSPFDRLVHDRVRLAELFDFEYVLEMYKPKARRRWGYFALPILHDDRLVGKVDATADRRSGTFLVHAVHRDAPFTGAMTEAVRAEVRDLASWLRLTATMAAGADRTG